LYFSHVETNKISGFKINKSDLTAEKVWQIDFGNKEVVIDVKTQYQTASLAAEHSSVLPTAFGEDGILLYKYLDSNMYAVTT